MINIVGGFLILSQFVVRYQQVCSCIELFFNSVGMFGSSVTKLIFLSFPGKRSQFVGQFLYAQGCRALL